ncbi:MAG: CsgG/HfaB family protein [Nitrosomonadales bacterium]
MKLKFSGMILLVIIMLCSCGKKEEVTNSTVLPSSSSVSAVLPDVGKVDTVLTKAEGFGETAATATTDAMKTAILQVNGTTIDAGSVRVKYGLDVTDGKDAVSLRASEFAEMVAQKSGGAITNFKIINIAEPKESVGIYKVIIEANIAHFTAPSDSKKIKVVVASIHFDSPSFVIGSESIPAQKVAEDITQQVATALTNTGRFSVLDRDSGADIEKELNMIKEGKTSSAETGKLGQSITADIIWIGTINTLAYNRHTRQLRTSDRELVSYSGGWDVAQKLVNVATRQVMISDTLKGNAPDVDPTTMSSGINANQVLLDMESEIVNEVVTSILARTFPITVVSLEGNTVVLSQGGESVKTGSRYAMVKLGKEMKDPQTGESLGRIESPCCEVVIDKTTPKLSYGHLENVKVSLDGIPDGGLQLSEQIKTAPTNAPETESKVAISSEKIIGIRKAHSKSTQNNEKPASIQDSKEDGKW